MRVRSGNWGVISGEAKWTWHSVLTISGSTCLEWLQEWSRGGSAARLGKRSMQICDKCGISYQGQAVLPVRYMSNCTSPECHGRGFRNLQNSARGAVSTSYLP